MHPILQNLKALEKLGTISPGASEEVSKSAADTLSLVEPIEKDAQRGGGIGGFLSSALARPAGAIVGAGLVLSGLATASAIQSASMASKHKEVIKDISKDPDLNSDKDKANRIYGMMIRYAPGLATDPMVAKATVKSLMTMPESYLTYDVAKKLTEAEKEYDVTHGLLAKFKKIV